jgi:hypothetical protein
MFHICYNWVIYLSGKVTYRTWRKFFNKKIDDRHNFIISFVSTREENSSIIVSGGEGGGLVKVEFDQSLSEWLYPGEEGFRYSSIIKIGIRTDV